MRLSPNEIKLMFTTEYFKSVDYVCSVKNDAFEIDDSFNCIISDENLVLIEKFLNSLPL
jgi:hypothetical protein